MKFTRGRHLLALIGICAVGALLSPTAVQAAPIDDIGVEFPDLLVPTSRTAKAASVALTNAGDTEVDLHDVRVVIDTSGLAGIATVSRLSQATGGVCTTAGTTITCTFSAVNVASWGTSVVFVDVMAVAGTRVGQQGTLRVTASAANLPTRTNTATITLAEGVNLVAGPEITLAGDPGTTLSLAPTVRNAGATPVNGAVLSSSTGSEDARYQPQYSNCSYTNEQFFCQFDEVLAPGRVYVPASPIAVVLRGDAPAPSTFDTYAEWQTPDDATPWVESIRRHGAVPGTGPRLRLIERSALPRANAQTETSAIDNFTHVVVNVTGRNFPDGAGVGTTVRGVAGQVVTARVGVRNLGPARLGWGDDGAPGAHIEVPAGTTVVSIDEKSCRPATASRSDPQPPLLGARAYRCLTFDIAVGETYTWDFGLRIDDAAPSVGTITARTYPFGDGPFGPDRDPNNNTAQILVNPPGGTDIGILPVTGDTTGFVAGAGVALVALGAGGYLVARRRRIRFVA